jgi:uncharacterized protein involved in type VI secretion and phage assembly
MASTLMEALMDAAPREQVIYGVAVAEVINNLDASGLGRVQLRFPWLPGLEPWARVAALSGGKGRGTYFIPQEHDEVLVAFSHGDLREPFVIGSLWSKEDPPPEQEFTAPVLKRVIRTPGSHQIVFDDAANTITINTEANQRIVIGPSKIELHTDQDASTVVLDKSGSVSITAKNTIEMKADSISIEGNTISVKADLGLSLDGGESCDINAGLVSIN